MPDLPWYQNGLRFECSECGDCCTGAPGFVWVSPEEIAELAQELDMDSASFQAQFVRDVGARKSLTERANGDCVFFDATARNCTVYDARPIQCKTWPFWNSNLESPKAWAATCKVCPGSGQGKLHILESIESQRKQIDI